MYNLATGSLEVKLTGIRTPSSVACYTDSIDSLYFVNEKRESSINKYDVNWNLLTRMGGNGNGNGDLDNPRQIIYSPMSTIWVADYLNERVEEFSTDGKWLRHVLEEIGKPSDLSIHPQQPEYLWLTYREATKKFASKCYKIY